VKFVHWGCKARAPRARYSGIASVFLAFGLALPASAEEVSKQQLQGLDEQVQEIKTDVLDISAELTRLEEQLLYPSGTQVAVFVALAEGESFRLDSVEVRIDGEPVARHLYSFQELEALQKGGVQRIYTGNVAGGAHRLAVSVLGMRPNGEELTATEHFSFDKGIEPKRVAITLADGDAGEAPIQLGGW
jgi:hypothetical protein